jgi:hypothetical protein
MTDWGRGTGIVVEGEEEDMMLRVGGWMKNEIGVQVVISPGQV